MKELLNKPRRTVKVKFLDSNVDVKKLTVAEVEDFQDFINSAKDAEKEGLAVQRKIIRLGVVGAEDLTDDELNSFPLDDLSKLAEAVLVQAGVNTEKK